MKPFLITIPAFFLVLGVLFCSLNSVGATEAKPKTRKANRTPIEHVIILMLENRSFDHMLGFLKKQNPEINGCLPNEAGCSNPDRVSAENPTYYTVDDTAVYQQADPLHSIAGTTFQIYGKDSDEGPATMQGFIESYTKRTNTDGAPIMKCFSPEHVPVITNLTMEYTVFDSWFVSVPGPTMPNRAYAASASSHGMGTSNVPMIVKGLPQKTMFRQMEEMGLDYRIYFEQIPALLMFKDLRHKDARARYGSMKKFYEDVAAGDLPELTWIEPIYYTTQFRAANDQHPDHDVSLGDQLIKDIYESVRNSALWNSTALIITYDEHGGFFDHVPPLDEGVPSPDNINSTDDPFDFTRLGVRVPTVVVSPWVKKGAVIHQPAATGGQYEHSSFAATIVHKLFQPAHEHAPKPDYLNNRDAWAATFESLFTELTAPREDCPVATATANSEVHQAATPKQDGNLLLSDFQRELVALAAGVSEDSSMNYEATEKWTEKQAAHYVTERVNRFFGYEIVPVDRE